MDIDMDICSQDTYIGMDMEMDTDMCMDVAKDMDRNMVIDTATDMGSFNINFTKKI
jgi:hypothetical protein